MNFATYSYFHNRFYSNKKLKDIVNHKQIPPDTLTVLSTCGTHSSNWPTCIYACITAIKHSITTLLSITLEITWTLTIPVFITSNVLSVNVFPPSTTPISIHKLSFRISAERADTPTVKLIQIHPRMYSKTLKWRDSVRCREWPQSRDQCVRVLQIRYILCTLLATPNVCMSLAHRAKNQYLRPA